MLCLVPLSLPKLWCMNNNKIMHAITGNYSTELDRNIIFQIILDVGNN